MILLPSVSTYILHEIKVVNGADNRPLSLVMGHVLPVYSCEQGGGFKQNNIFVVVNKYTIYIPINIR